MEQIECGCGCGALIPIRDGRGRPRRFVRGHGSFVQRGKPKRGTPRVHPISIEDRLLQRIACEPNSGCWLWLGRMDRNGYGILLDRNRPLWAHRAAWRTWRGEIPAGLVVCHRCDTPACINPDHLFVGTQGDNIRDAARKGRTASGERQWNAKLKTEEVLAIRALVAEGVYQRTIAAQFGVSQSTVSDIASRRKWPHLG
jgi:predicted XRE-type DNA-binding protein